jgi:hypothetical protein
MYDGTTGGSPYVVGTVTDLNTIELHQAIADNNVVTHLSFTLTYEVA